MTFELDEILLSFAKKYELSLSSLNGILMARLFRLNVETENEEELYELLEMVLQKKHEINGDNRTIN
jgi:hypothetical protein